MGWASGSEIAIDVVTVVRDEVSDPQARERIYRVLFKSLRGQDWDTVDEAMGIDDVFDEVTEDELKRHGNW